jgi:regulator of RNase E activity RraA
VAQAGDVIVVDAAEKRNFHLGRGYVRPVQDERVAGAVIEGAMPDTDETRDGFFIIAKAIVPRTTQRPILRRMDPIE